MNDCPCGSGATYNDCCQPLHLGEALAATPEQLMRSRYAAYALGEFDYVFRTWHPRTRPADVTTSPDLKWTKLEIVAADGDTVEFRAHFSTSVGGDVMHELSTFTQRAGRWVYVSGVER